jgi:hypothetical protein
MRRLICAGVYWLIEHLLDQLDRRKAARDEKVRRAAALKGDWVISAPGTKGTLE